MIKLVLTLTICYLIGSISGSYLLGKILLKKDVREYGSGNAGTTNAIRVFGRKIGIFTFLIDMLKGFFVAFLLSKYQREYLYIGIFFTIIGHNYPFYMKFKGGKGIATTFGAFLYLNPIYSVIAFFILLLIGRITSYVSVGSIVFLILNFIVSIFKLNLTKNEIVIVFIISLLGIFRHRSNIKRLVEGNELKSRGK